MSSKSSASSPRSKRLEFSRFTQEDASEFAHVLSDPEVTRSIMAKATTPEQCLTCARQRIDWHNSSWDTLGYGVWALREKALNGLSAGPVIGWCGLTATAHGPTPEILYGFSRAHWGAGLATEAALAAIEWAFQTNICDRIDAVIFGPLNPGSSAVAEKLGMKHTGAIRFDDFLPDQELGRDVLDYEIWRMREGPCIDFRDLLFQAAFKSGLLVSAGVADEEATLSNLVTAAIQRHERPDVAQHEIHLRIQEAYKRGINECVLDIYQISETAWAESRPQ